MGCLSRGFDSVSFLPRSRDNGNCGDVWGRLRLSRRLQYRSSHEEVSTGEGGNSFTLIMD